MKDLRGNEIKAGDIIHVFGKLADGSEFDAICTAVRTRGRGIKFVTDDERTLTSDYLTEIGASLVIQERVQVEESVPKGKPSHSVTQDELDMIAKLRNMGWYGSLYKRETQKSLFHIEIQSEQEL